MANLERVTDFTNKYSDNLLSTSSLFNDSPVINYNGNGTLNIVDGYGISNNLKSAELYTVQNISYGIDEIFDFGSALSYNTVLDGNYIFQFSLNAKEINANPDYIVNLQLDLYIDSVLTDSFVNPLNLTDLTQEDFYTFTQSFNVIEGKNINFKFKIFAGSVGTPNPNFTLNFSGFKLELDNKQIGTPTIYSFPINGSTELKERVIVNQSNVASTLGGTIDGDKEYFIDGIVDMSGVEVLVPAGGLNLKGYNLKASRLICSDDNYTMFYSPVSGSGDVLFLDLAIEVTGLNSKVYNLKSATGFEAFESNRINYDNCVSLGVVDNYRQGLEFGNGRFGGTPTLELKGTWLGGYRITTSIVRNLDPAMNAPLFKAGAGFVMNSRFLTDLNVDLGNTANLTDFSSSNFVKTNSFKIFDAEITRNGVYNPLDTNINTNLTQDDLVCYWESSSGILNTYIGAGYKVTAEVPTTFGAINTYTDLLGTFTPNNLVHFDSPANGQLRNLSDVTIDYKCSSQFVIAGTANEDITLRLSVYRDATASFEEICTQTRVVNNLTGGRDVAYFSLNCDIRLFKNDYIKVEIKNLSSTASATSELDSFFNVFKR